MAIIAGIDGCKGGWLCIEMDTQTRQLHSRVCPAAQDLIGQVSMPAVIAIDIPIGLPESGSRQCDLIARKRLGKPRGSSVFPAPIRPTLKADSRKEADEILRSIDGKGVSPFAFGIYSKVREVDRLLFKYPHLSQIFHEIHPELSFWTWNQKQPLIEPKKSQEGAMKRRLLISQYFGKGMWESVRDQYGKVWKAIVGDDDISDAFAALWTAERINLGRAKQIPDPPEIDTHGLPMTMWF